MTKIYQTNRKHFNFSSSSQCAQNHSINHIEQCKKYEIRFTRKTTLFRRDFQNLYARATRTALSSNIHQFWIPKFNFFVSETAVKRISFYLEILRLYEVYFQQKIFESRFIRKYRYLCKFWQDQMVFCTNFYKIPASRTTRSRTTTKSFLNHFRTKCPRLKNKEMKKRWDKSHM